MYENRSLKNIQLGGDDGNDDDDTNNSRNL
jgi:hypothetical protein